MLMEHITYLTYDSDLFLMLHVIHRGPRARDRMVVGFTTTYAIIAYHR